MTYPAENVVYLSPSGTAHWADPIGMLLVSSCQGVSMRAWEQVPARSVLPAKRCRGGGCRRLWEEFVARSTGGASCPNGGVTEH